MLAALRWRLTLLFTALTALVLAGLLALTCHMAAAQQRTAAETLFRNTFAALCDRLQAADAITDRWLAAQEANNCAALFVADNGTPLQLAGAWLWAAEREALYKRAAPLAADLLPGRSAFGNVTGAAGERYFAAAAVLPRGTKDRLQVVYLQADAAAAKITALRWQYALLWLAGTLALALVSWWLAGQALKPTRAALQRQNEFVAAASHELRSPLAVIKASLAAAQAPDMQAPARQSLLAGAEKEADRMARLTGDLLLLAGGDASALRAKADLAPTALDTLCLEVYEQYTPLAREKQHPLTLILPEGDAVPTLPADAARLRQLLGILLNNALDHTPPGTPVELRLESLPGRRGGARLCVADRGPGIPDADKARVFDRFVRGDAARSDRAHFGLGLSVAREIADLHGAKLRVEDTPGGGAAFALTLPAGPLACKTDKSMLKSK